MLYVGLDVLVGRTAVCVVDAAGRVIGERSVASTPEAIAAVIKAAGTEEVARVGLKAGLNSAFLARGLLAAGLPAIVIDAAHAAAALRTGFRNKTDRNDARGIADLMRVDKFRPVWVKSPAAQRDRALLTVREQLRRQSLDARNTVDHFLKVTRSCRPGLFHGYAVAGLPRTDNGLERLFGSCRRHERRATGREADGSATVLRGPARLLAGLATRLRRRDAGDPARADRARWREVRASLERRRHARVLRARFRRDPAAYLGRLEQLLRQPALPTYTESG